MAAARLFRTAPAAVVPYVCGPWITRSKDLGKWMARAYEMSGAYSPTDLLTPPGPTAWTSRVITPSLLNVCVLKAVGILRERFVADVVTVARRPDARQEPRLPGMVTACRVSRRGPGPV